MKHKSFFLFVSILCLLALVMGSTPAAAAFRPAGGIQSSRTGAWLDSILFSRVDSASAVNELAADNIDIYLDSLPVSEIPQIDSHTELTYSESFGLYYELTINPAGPFFSDGRLNPFHSPVIREALNWLVDRQYLSDSIFFGTAVPKFVPIVTYVPEYYRYVDTITALEAEYAYDFTRAEIAITAEMISLGAVLDGGVWKYSGNPIIITFIIRNDSDGTRIPIGDYVADQLETLGFTLDRRYMSSSQASALWLNSDPDLGQWHLYTGAWSATSISRNEADNFQFFYSPNSAYGFAPLWQAYEPSPAFYALMDDLAYNDFTSLDERDAAFTQALESTFNDDNGGSLRIWLLDGRRVTPRREEVVVSADLAGGVAATQSWPLVTRFRDGAGGQLRAGLPDYLVDPINPIAGSSWMFDQTWKLATQDDAFMPDPFTGLLHPQRVESAAITAVTGTLIHKTLDWITLDFAPEIHVPPDAWVDWDAPSQTFITADDAYPGGLTARIKSTVIYPADMFTTVQWHDGSPLDVSDFVMNMILTFDRAKQDSPIYDEYYYWYDHDLFRGVRIVSTSPLVIETYWNVSFALDAELVVSDWFPTYDSGQAPWHTLALAARAEAEGSMAFSADKAYDLGIPWTDFVSHGQTLDLLNAELVQAAAENYIPYAGTLANYITPAEAAARWSRLQTWYASHGHFWIGTGPFFLDDLPSYGTEILLTRFASFPDDAGKWDAFTEFPCELVTEIPPMECEILVNFYHLNGGVYWDDNNRWLVGLNPGTWAGITTNGGRVTEMQLASNGLFSYIPPEVGNLTGLTILRLNNNRLIGGIPESFANLGSLYPPGGAPDGGDGLDLSNNWLTVPEDYPNPENPLHMFLLQLDPDWHQYQTEVVRIFLPITIR